MTICLWMSILSVAMILFQQNKLIYKFGIISMSFCGNGKSVHEK